VSFKTGHKRATPPGFWPDGVVHIWIEKNTETFEIDLGKMREGDLSSVLEAQLFRQAC